MWTRVLPVGLPMGRENGAGGDGARDWFEMTPTVVSLQAQGQISRTREGGSRS